MTRTTRTLLLAGLIVLAGWAMGAQDQGIKIGVVDIDQALNSTDEGKAAREELARKKREADQELQPMIERFGTMREEIDGKKYVLSDQALFTKQADLLELKNKIDNKIKELEGQLQIDKGRLEAPLRAKLVEIIQGIGKDQGFTLILRRDAPGVMYTREALDITEEVISRFNKKRS
jgi:outer membrane protein